MPWKALFSWGILLFFPEESDQNGERKVTERNKTESRNNSTNIYWKKYSALTPVLSKRLLIKSNCLQMKFSVRVEGGDERRREGNYLSSLGYSGVQRRTHACTVSACSWHTRPDTSLHMPTHTETTQLVGRLKVTDFYRYTSKLRASDTGATNSDEYVFPIHESFFFIIWIKKSAVGNDCWSSCLCWDFLCIKDQVHVSLETHLETHFKAVTDPELCTCDWTTQDT